jgi:hypothetical protein
MRLKHEADLAVANLGELQVVEGGEIFAIQQDFAARGAIQRADDLQQRALTRNRSARRWRGIRRARR